MARRDEPKEPELYRARSSGTIRIEGTRYTYLRRQTILPANHPLVRALPGRFELLRVTKVGPEVSAVSLAHGVEVDARPVEEV